MNRRRVTMKQIALYFTLAAITTLVFAAGYFTSYSRADAASKTIFYVQ